ncbi:MAG TPA: dynamin family protein, partial [Candidatus Wallbacteria bacterium]|nr:dynamin family protein [Candidatus Wallbacteria bacterium]
RRGGTEIDEAAVIAQRTAAGTDLTGLREYVSVKGSFTPLVKAVRIKYPADILKKMTIVDTPGINDPNALRSMITEKWINRSDAVVFLLSAAQPFTMEDRLFFDRYLASVPPSKIIAAVSKIDLAEEAGSIKDFVAGALVKALGKNGEKIIEKEKLCLIAPMFSFFQKLKSLEAASKIKLSPERAAEIDYQLSERPKSSAFLKEVIAAGGYMKKFLDSLETHLVASRESLLESHIKKIDAVFQYHLKNHENEKSAIEAEIASLKNRSESLAVEKEKTCAEKSALCSIRETINAEINKLGGFFNQRVEEISSGAADKIIKNIIASRPLNDLAANLAFESFSMIENGFRELNARFDEYIDKFKAGILELAPKISETDTETGVLFKNSAGQVFNKIDAARVLNDIKKIVNAGAGAAVLSGLTVKWLYFWTDETKTKARFTETIKRIFIEDLSLQRVILTAGTDAVSAVKTSLGQFLFRFDARISALKKIEDEKSEAIKSAAAAVKKLEDELRTREKAADEIMAKKSGIMDHLR